MSETIQKALAALKDVQGIEGSFVLNADGALLAMEMPALFDAALFKDVGPRIERLAESFSSFGDEFESCVMRFADHLLCVKQFARGGALCILTNGSVNLPALKMAINLTHRRLVDEIDKVKPMSMPAPAAAAPPPPPAPSAMELPIPGEVASVNGFEGPVPERRAPRYYRGQLVDE